MTGVYTWAFFPFILSNSSKELSEMQQFALSLLFLYISNWKGKNNEEKGGKHSMCYLISAASRYCPFNSGCLYKHLIML